MQIPNDDAMHATTSSSHVLDPHQVIEQIQSHPPYPSNLFTEVLRSSSRKVLPNCPTEEEVERMLGLHRNPKSTFAIGRIVSSCRSACPQSSKLPKFKVPHQHFENDECPCFVRRFSGNNSGQSCNTRAAQCSKKDPGPTILSIAWRSRSSKPEMSLHVNVNKCPLNQRGKEPVRIPNDVIVCSLPMTKWIASLQKARISVHTLPHSDSSKVIYQARISSRIPRPRVTNSLFTPKRSTRVPRNDSLTSSEYSNTRSVCSAVSRERSGGRRDSTRKDDCVVIQNTNSEYH